MADYLRWAILAPCKGGGGRHGGWRRMEERKGGEEGSSGGEGSEFDICLWARLEMDPERVNVGIAEAKLCIPCAPLPRLPPPRACDTGGPPH